MHDNRHLLLSATRTAHASARAMFYHVITAESRGASGMDAFVEKMMARGFRKVQGRDDLSDKLVECCKLDSKAVELFGAYLNATDASAKRKLHARWVLAKCNSGIRFVLSSGCGVAFVYPIPSDRTVYNDAKSWPAALAVAVVRPGSCGVSVSDEAYVSLPRAARERRDVLDVVSGIQVLLEGGPASAAPVVCGICHDELSRSCATTTCMACEFAVHRDCISRWNRPDCPQCRMPFAAW